MTVQSPMEQEVRNALALMRINYFNLAGLRQLYDAMGSATAIVEHKSDLRDVMPDASPRLLEGLAGIDEALKRADAELEFCRKHAIEPLAMSDARYPQRLCECDDAPLALFFRGTADLNARHIVSVVGTRHCTAYGQDLINRFVSDLKELLPDALVVSGLAYGADICAHRKALACGLDTVAVLAHGLDTIYPARHRETAKQMLAQGGLLTEYFTQTNADKVNFVRRNRIVAGMADAVIVVESAEKGGSLITARLSREYNRDTFAFPGAVGAPYSAGCNRLIARNEASLITSAADFVEAMGWQNEAALRAAQHQGIERQLFPELTDEEQIVVGALTKQNDRQVNLLAVDTNLPVSRLTALLFELELKGVIKPLAGGIYHLIM